MFNNNSIMKHQLQNYLQELSVVRNREQELEDQINKMRNSLTVDDVVTFPDYFSLKRFCTTSTGKELVLLQTGPRTGCLMTGISTCKCAYTYLKSTDGVDSVTFKAWIACRMDFIESLESPRCSDEEMLSDVVNVAKSTGVERVFTGGLRDNEPFTLDGITIIRCGGSEPQYQPFIYEGENIGENHSFLGLGSQIR
jgi:hypothetical protein